MLFVYSPRTVPDGRTLHGPPFLREAAAATDIQRQSLSRGGDQTSEGERARAVRTDPSFLHSFVSPGWTAGISVDRFEMSSVYFMSP